MLGGNHAAAAAVVLVVAASGGVAAAAPVGLASYLAEYELELHGTAEAPDIASVAGLLVLEFRGSACAGYSNDARIVTSIATNDGDELVTDVRTKTFETADGRLEFANQTYVGSDRVENAVGEAQHAGNGIDVTLSEPMDDAFRVEGDMVFPTEHMLRIVEAARDRRAFMAVDLYDGSQDGQLVYQTATIIGAASDALVDGEDASLIADAGMEGMRFWPVTISYFEKSDVRSDAMPDFVMSFKMFENGIGRAFRIDYGDFALDGHLRGLEILPTEPCL